MTATECAHSSQEDLDRGLLKCVLDANKELLQELLDAGANALSVDGEKGSPLSCAIASGDKEMVRMLLTTVGDMAQPCTAEGLPPLHLAAKEGQCRIVELLCENNADVNSYYEGCRKWSQDGCPYSAGTSSKYGRGEPGMPLHLACNANYPDVVEALIKDGAKIDCEDSDSRTPLHHVSERGFLIIAEILLRHGASVNSRCHGMVTPLHFAVRKGNVDVARLLLEHGAEVNARDRLDQSVLYFAINSNTTEVVELLVKNGADMNNVAYDRQTALHWACELEYKDIVEVLLDNGADVNIEAMFYGTPLEWVLKLGNHVCLEVLERHIIKLMAASLYVMDSNLRAISAAAKLAAFQKECECEIKRIKQYEMHNRISFYYVLAHDTNHVAVYAKNRVVHQAMMSGEYKTMFPIYAKMIENSFLKGQRRLELLEASLESLNSLIGHRLPYMFLMDVLMYLNEEDHQNLMASTKEGESQ